MGSCAANPSTFTDILGTIAGTEGISNIEQGMSNDEVGRNTDQHGRKSPFNVARPRACDAMQCDVREHCIL
ncbi:MAG: hypothetical protein ACODAD_07760 [Planctomycetota bacterium]